MTYEMNSVLQNILGYQFVGNSLLQIITSGFFMAAGVITISLLKRYLKKRTIGSEEGNGKSRAHKLFQMQNYAAPLAYCIIIYSALISVLTLSAQTNKVIHVIFIIAASIFSLRLISHVVKDSLKSYLVRRDRERSVEQIDRSIRGISTFINIVVWIIGAIFIIDNIGFNISAIVTGVGIGGIALALASQAILGDLFNYFVIFFDQPFKIGDFIVIDDKMGTIEKIGIKTTRIRSLQGEEIILSNTNLTNSRIHNYKRMYKRRVLLSIGVVYQTTPEQIESIPKIMRGIIEETEGVEFDRAHFSGYGESGLLFEIVYYISSADYNYYMDKQQGINLQILKKFNELGIDFAYPTRTLYLENK
jgi:small-conductance mechanosensitive channel